MSCNSMMSTLMTASTAVAANGVIPLGAVDHALGKTISLENNSIVFKKPGHYIGQVVVTVSATSAAAYAVSSSYSSSVVSVTAASGDYITITYPISVYVNCCNKRNSINFVLSTAGNVTNVVSTIFRVED